MSIVSTPDLKYDSNFLDERDWIMVFGDDLSETFLTKCFLEKRFPFYKVVILESRHRLVSEFSAYVSPNALNRLKLIFCVNKNANLLQADRLKLMFEIWLKSGFDKAGSISLALSCLRDGIFDRKIENDYGLNFNTVLDWNGYLESIESNELTLF